VAKVHLADDAAYAHGLAENVAPLIVDLMAITMLSWRGHHHGQEHRPRVAALLDVAQLRNHRGGRPKTFQRPIYAGNAIATVERATPSW
jgi:electron transfer flavoprotein alpha subunit